MEIFYIILYIIGMSWGSNLLAWRLEFEVWLWLKRRYLTMRLFNCSVCLSFWISFIFNIILTGCLGLSIILSLVISFVAALMEDKLCRLS
jgi:hypothetical protein